MSHVNGKLFTVRAGGYVATVSEIGGCLHSLEFDGRPLVVSFERDAVRPNHRGSVLAPWPNRVGDGAYTWEGESLQLALSEPDRGNAIHGLVSWLPFTLLDEGEDYVVVGARIWPQQGYPFVVDVEVTYALSEAGLRWTVRGTNAGDRAAPYGSSVHPYLVAGPGHVDDWTLQVPASRVLDVDPERLLPREVVDVPAPLDFRTARTVADTEIDHAYTGFSTGRVEVRAADGSGVAMESDAAWFQVHTADRPEPDRNRIGMAVEPMTCPPDAFRTGVDLVTLAPGESHELSLQISGLSGA